MILWGKSVFPNNRGSYKKVMPLEGSERKMIHNLFWICRSIIRHDDSVTQGFALHHLEQRILLR